MQLVIAEKPSVAQAIAGVIGAGDKKDGYMEGNGYIVINIQNMKCTLLHCFGLQNHFMLVTTM